MESNNSMMKLEYLINFLKLLTLARKKVVIGRIMNNTMIGIITLERKVIVFNVKTNVIKMRIVAQLNVVKVTVRGGEMESVVEKKSLKQNITLAEKVKIAYI